METLVLNFKNLAIFALEIVVILGFSGALISGLSKAERKLGLEHHSNQQV